MANLQKKPQTQAQLRSELNALRARRSKDAHRIRQIKAELTARPIEPRTLNEKLS